MFMRTATKPETPEREDMDLEHAMCPPHDFEFGWATKHDANPGDDTVPGIFCRSCGEVRAFKLSAE